MRLLFRGLFACAAGFILTWPASPAIACLSCSCGGSGTASDLGAAGGAASFFGMGTRWLWQQGVSLRQVTGSFNDRGSALPVPLEGSLVTLQGTTALSYFPWPGVSLGLQAPVLGHLLDRAAWGMFGSLEATDTARRVGGGLGDLSLQGSSQLAEWEHAGLAAWGSLSAPSGQAAGEATGLTGQGFWTGGAGLVGLAQWEDWEGVANAGYQLPLGGIPLANPFSLGPTWLYQLHVNRRLGEHLRLGLGLNGFAGAWVATAGPAQPTAKLKLVGSALWAFSPLTGVRLAVGLDPEHVGARNAMRDLTFYLIGYQYVP
ncbi:MAG: hypothetical protein VKP62_02175 [Candidatus Sericytochromatia bacterium]|nr:hypothetical protein [Candidatus Sericytochromatia bacterium]